MNSVPLAGKTVLVRVDFNTTTERGKVIDDFRIRAHVPTIKRLLDQNCKVVLIAHLGRPDGSRVQELSLQPAAERLAELLRRKVTFIDDVLGLKVRSFVKQAPKNSVIVLENLRFNVGEQMNDEQFAQALVGDTGAEYFVQDAFSVVHRDHASMSVITSFIPSVAGLYLEQEVTDILNAISEPKRPLVLVVGGTKVEDKVRLLCEMIGKADEVIVGGTIANAILQYRGYSMGMSTVNEQTLGAIDGLYRGAIEQHGYTKVDDVIVLPSDVAVADRSGERMRRVEVNVNYIKSDHEVLDLGQESIAEMIRLVESAGTVIWAGTLGRTEIKSFSYGSTQLAMALAAHTKATSIVGGGHTAGFMEQYIREQGDKSLSHISSGGNATLALIAGDELPGIKHLLDESAKIRYTKEEEA